MITRYLDTSVLVPFYAQEARTADAQNWLADLGNSPLAVSPWGIAEFSSALGLKARRGELTQTNLSIAEAEFRRFVASRVQIVEVITRDFYQASEWCAHWQLGLRVGDALHLAIAERSGLTVCTLDQGMLKAAQTLSLSIETF